jgi:hypothetical protein
MDRQIIYPAAIPQDTDLLSTNKNALVGLGYALQDILGASTCVAGLPCTQTLVASLAVLVGAGRVYSLQNIDGTAYGTLAADTADQIIKQGIQLGSVTLATPAPVTAGQSINYLIEASYQDSDTTPVVLPFYNSANPAVPFSGPGGLGATSNTQRKGAVVVQVKAGIPATTGTQTTPAPDSGFVGLYSVTVANGQATVTSTNIVQLPTAPFLPSNIASPLAAAQQIDLSLTSTALVNTSLSLPLAVGRHAIDMLLDFTGITTGTQGIQFSVGGTAVLGGSGSGLGAYAGRVNGAGVTSFWNGVQGFATIDVQAAVSALMVRFSIVIATAGTYIIQAAQNTSSANATKLLGGSSIFATKIG